MGGAGVGAVLFGNDTAADTNCANRTCNISSRGATSASLRPSCCGDMAVMGLRLAFMILGSVAYLLGNIRGVRGGLWGWRPW